MKNESGLQPRGRAVLVKMLGQVAERPKGARIVIPENVREKTDMVEQKALVLAVGPSAWNDEGTWTSKWFGIRSIFAQKNRAEVGEIVLVTKFAGFMAVGLDGKSYRLVNDRDIFCAIDPDWVRQDNLREVANG